jgi:hypothetical protein
MRRLRSQGYDCEFGRHDGQIGRAERSSSWLMFSRHDQFLFTVPGPASEFADMQIWWAGKINICSCAHDRRAVLSDRGFFIEHELRDE